MSFSLMSFTDNKMGRRKAEYKEKQQGLKIILHYHPFSERHVSLILHEAAERIVDSKIPGKTSDWWEDLRTNWEIKLFCYINRSHVTGWDAYC